MSEKPQVPGAEPSVIIEPALEAEARRYDERKNEILGAAIEGAVSPAELASNLADCLLSDEIRDSATLEAIQHNVETIQAIDTMLAEKASRKEIMDRIATVSEKLDLQGKLRELVENILDRRGSPVTTQEALRHARASEPTRISRNPLLGGRGSDDVTRISRAPLSE